MQRASNSAKKLSAGQLPWWGRIIVAVAVLATLKICFHLAPFQRMTHTARNFRLAPLLKLCLGAAASHMVRHVPQRRCQSLAFQVYRALICPPVTNANSLMGVFFNFNRLISRLKNPV